MLKYDNQAVIHKPTDFFLGTLSYNFIVVTSSFYLMQTRIGKVFKNVDKEQPFL